MNGDESSGSENLPAFMRESVNLVSYTRPTLISSEGKHGERNRSPALIVEAKKPPDLQSLVAHSSLGSRDLIPSPLSFVYDASKLSKVSLSTFATAA
jgi:hypothetical protein